MLGSWKELLRKRADRRCRFCNTSTKTIDHLISGCTILAPNEYIHRHNSVGHYIHWKIWNHYHTETPEKWCEDKPLPVVDTPKVTILWDLPIRTNITLQANRPDIVIKHKQNKACQLIEIEIEIGNFIMETEIAKMWKMKTKTIPVIVEAFGVIKKGTQKYVNEIPGNLSLAKIKKNSVK